MVDHTPILWPRFVLANHTPTGELWIVEADRIRFRSGWWSLDAALYRCNGCRQERAARTTPNTAGAMWRGRSEALPFVLSPLANTTSPSRNGLRLRPQRSGQQRTVASGPVAQATAALPSGTLRAYRDLPTVGDWVWVRPAGEFSLIEAVEARKTAFIRRAAGRVHAAQCVAANIDRCFVVCGLDGDFNMRRIERYLILTLESGARPVVALNKADVCADVDAAIEAVRGIAGRADVIAMSASRSVDPLRPWLQPGVTAAPLV